MIVKSRNTDLYTELTWDVAGFDNLKNRKSILASSIWGEFVKDKYLYIKILYFKSYDFAYCSKRVARYKKVLKSDTVPSVIKNALKRSEEISLISTTEYDIYAIETIDNATENAFIDACSLLHDSHNRCLIILGNTEEFTAKEKWARIYDNLSKNSPYLPEPILQDLLANLETSDALVRTHGFFDDPEIGFSVLVKNERPSLKNRTT